jgi:hypothetical protein
MKVRSKYFVSLVALVCLAIMGYQLVNKQFFLKEGDKGDAPEPYGEAIHYKPEIGPYFGKVRGDNDKHMSNDTLLIFPEIDDSSGVDDEDAFSFNFTDDPNSQIGKCFLPDIDINNKLYSISIPFANNHIGDPVNGWIDFNGNSIFDPSEMASAISDGKDHITLTWLLPELFVPCMTYARLRTTTAENAKGIEIPVSTVNYGEVEDYQVRMIANDPIALDDDEIRDTLNMDAYEDTAAFVDINAFLKNISFCNSSLQVAYTNSFKPDILQFTKRHDLVHTGIRLGHFGPQIENDPKYLYPTVEKPIQVGLKLLNPIENLKFEILDIDAGDYIQIKTFLKGVEKDIKYKNISTFFYYNYDKEKNIFFNLKGIDAGTTNPVFTSSHSGISVTIAQLVDSIAITYFDEYAGGSFSIVNISGRKNNLPAINIPPLQVVQKKEAIEIDATLGTKNELRSAILFHSSNGSDFKPIQTISNISNITKLTFMHPITQLTKSDNRYILKIVEKDGHATASAIATINADLNVQKQQAFVARYNRADSSILLSFKKSSNNPIKVSVINYEGKTIYTNTFKTSLANTNYLIKRKEGNEFENVSYFRIETEGKLFYIPLYY